MRPPDSARQPSRSRPSGTARAVESDAVREGTQYAQPTPRLLYVHDDLTDEVSRRFGLASPAAALARELFALTSREGDRVRVLTLSEQIDRVLAQGPHAPFGLALAIGTAGERVARSEEHTSELQSLRHLVCRLLLEKKDTGQVGIHEDGDGALASRNVLQL